MEISFYCLYLYKYIARKKDYFSPSDSTLLEVEMVPLGISVLKKPKDQKKSKLLVMSKCGEDLILDKAQAKEERSQTSNSQRSS